MTYNKARYESRKNDPEFKRKRKEYSAKRYQEKRAEINAASRAWALAHPERVREIDTAARLRRLTLYIYRNVKKRAKKTGQDFSIDYSDVVVPDVCPIFGVPFNLKGAAGDCDYSPSIDRIDSSKGYVKGNIQVISKLANCMKWTATPEQIEAFCRGMLDYLKRRYAKAA